jgi:ferredoxin
VAIRIEVSAARCIAAKSCIHAAEGVFAIVNGVSTVVDPTAGTLDDVLAAVEECPTGAITVRDEGRQP